jgi:hypothetical protein
LQVVGMRPFGDYGRTARNGYSSARRFVDGTMMQGIGQSSRLLAHRGESFWLLGLMAMTACSWVRWAVTGSIKVDENYPSQLAGSLLFVGLIAGWTLLVLGWCLLLDRPPENPRWLALGGLLLASLMLPMLSNDVFSLMAYGSLAARGHDVYTTAGALPHSGFYNLVGERWNDKVCVYGPTTLFAVLPVALADHSPWTAMLLLRLTWLAPVALVMELSFRRLRHRPFFHAMVWLNPLFLVEGPGQLHADVLGVAAVVAGIVLTLPGGARGRAAGWLLYALALLGKYSFALAGVWFWLIDAHTTAQRLRRLTALACVVLCLAVLFFAPFWHGTATVTEPLRALASMNPGGSITEVAGILVDLLRDGGVPHADAPVTRTLALDRATHAFTWFAVSLVLRLVTLGIGIRVLWAMLRRPYDEDRIALGTGTLMVALITLASHRFQSWYLMAALPFFGLRCDRVWRRWWVAVVALSVSTELIHVLPRTSPLLPVTSVITNGGVVAVFLMSIRQRYLRFGDDARPPATEPAAP